MAVESFCMPDEYRSFDELSKKEASGGYNISLELRNLKFLVLAIHGGKIEPGTSELAKAIARDDLSFYCFEGVKPDHNRTLHVTSTNFDEPTALAMTREHQIAVSVHGFKSDAKITIIGGADDALRKRIGDALALGGFSTQYGSQHLGGASPDNICNKTRSGKGVQLEVSSVLRRLFLTDRNAMKLYASAVRVAIGAKK
jgi:phage replication-related protein YjqB (UPF0714/DUF867 family)